MVYTFPAEKHEAQAGYVMRLTGWGISFSAQSRQAPKPLLFLLNYANEWNLIPGSTSISLWCVHWSIASTKSPSMHTVSAQKLSVEWINKWMSQEQNHKWQGNIQVVMKPKHRRHFRLNAIKLVLLRPVLQDIAKQSARLNAVHKNNDWRGDEIFTPVGGVSAGGQRWHSTPPAGSGHSCRSSPVLKDSRAPSWAAEGKLPPADTSNLMSSLFRSCLVHFFFFNFSSVLEHSSSDVAVTFESVPISAHFQFNSKQHLQPSHIGSFLYSLNGNLPPCILVRDYFKTPADNCRKTRKDWAHSFTCMTPIGPGLATVSIRFSCQEQTGTNMHLTLSKALGLCQLGVTVLKWGPTWSSKPLLIAVEPCNAWNSLSQRQVPCPRDKELLVTWTGLETPNGFLQWHCPGRHLWS